VELSGSEKLDALAVKKYFDFLYEKNINSNHRNNIYAECGNYDHLVIDAAYDKENAVDRKSPVRKT
jgi:hypothetical protein